MTRYLTRQILPRVIALLLACSPACATDTPGEADWRTEFRSLKSMHESDQARELLNRVLQREPGNFEARCELALLSEDEEIAKKALANLRPAESSTDATVCRIWGEVLTHSLKSFISLHPRTELAAQAAATLRQAVRLAPKSAECWMALLDHLEACDHSAIPATAVLALRQLPNNAELRAEIDASSAIKRERYEANPLTNALLATPANFEVLEELRRWFQAADEAASDKEKPLPPTFPTQPIPLPPSPPAEATALLAALPQLDQDPDLNGRIAKISAALAKHRPFLDAYIARATTNERLADLLAGWVDPGAVKVNPAVATELKINEHIDAAAADYTRALQLAPDRLDLQLARARLLSIHSDVLADAGYRAAQTLAKDEGLRAELILRAGNSNENGYYTTNYRAALQWRWRALRTEVARPQLLDDFADLCRNPPNGESVKQLLPSDSAEVESECNASKGSFVVKAEESLYCADRPVEDATRYTRAWRLAVQSIAIVPTARAFRALAIASYCMGASHGSIACAEKEIARTFEKDESESFEANPALYSTAANFTGVAVILDPKDPLTDAWHGFFNALVDDMRDSAAINFERTMIGTSLAYGLSNPYNFFKHLSDEQSLAREGKPNSATHPLTKAWQASLADTYEAKRYNAEQLDADILAGRSHDFLKLVELVDELVRLKPNEGYPRKNNDWRKELNVVFASELADATAAKAITHIRSLSKSDNNAAPDTVGDELMAAAEKLDPNCTQLALARALNWQRMGNEEKMLSVIEQALSGRPAPAATAAELFELRAPVHLRNKDYAAWLVDRAAAATLRGEDVAAVEKDWLTQSGGQGSDDARLIQAYQKEYAPRDKAGDSVGSAVIHERKIAGVDRGSRRWKEGWTDEHEQRLAAVSWAEAGQFDRALATLDLVLKHTANTDLIAETYGNIAYTRGEMAIMAANKFRHFSLPYEYDKKLARELNTTLQTALAACDKADQVGTNQAWVSLERGYLQENVGHYAEAVAAYKKSVELEPKNTNYLDKLGLALIYDQHYGEAREILQRCLAELPADSGSRKRVERNLKHVENVLAQSPDFAHEGNCTPQPIEFAGPAGTHLSATRLTLGFDPTQDDHIVIATSKDGSAQVNIRRKGALGSHSLDDEKLIPSALYLNGRQIGEAATRISEIRLSANGQHVAYKAEFWDRRETVMIDGQPCAPHEGYDGMPGNGLDSSEGFSPDGSHFAFDSILDEGDKRHYTIFVDGQPGAALKDFSALRWQGNQLAYLGVQIDGKPVLVAKEHTTVLAKPGRDLIVSPDSINLAYIEGTSDDEHARVVFDGQSLGEPGKITKLAFSPDGKHLTWTAKTAGLWRIYLDGREVGVPASAKEFDRGLEFSADGSHWLAVGPYDTAKKIFAICHDGKLVELSVDNAGLYAVLSPDGTRWGALGDLGGKSRIFIDGKETASCLPFEAGFSLLAQYPCIAFSPDATHVAWIERVSSSTATVVIDGVRGPAYTHINNSTLRFSGGRAVYLASKDNSDDKTRYFICIDFGGYLIPSPNILGANSLVETAPGMIRFIGNLELVKNKQYDDSSLNTHVRVDIDVTKAPRIPSPAEKLAAQKELAAQQEKKAELKRQNSQAEQQADAAFRRARAAAKQNDLAGVEQLLQTALTANPRYVPALMMRAVLKATKKDLAGARTDLDAAVAADPKSAAALGTRARLRQQAGDQAGAEKDAAAAIALDPADQQARFTRAQTKYMSRDLPGAIGELDAALSGREKSAEAYVMRAQLHAALGKRAETIADIQSAGAADPGNAQLRIGLADMLLKLGDLEGARAQLQAAAKLGDARASAFLAKPPFVATPAPAKTN